MTRSDRALLISFLVGTGIGFIVAMAVTVTFGYETWVAVAGFVFGCLGAGISYEVAMGRW